VTFRIAYIHYMKKMKIRCVTYFIRWTTEFVMWL
jgi:hypothetical protein